MRRGAREELLGLEIRASALGLADACVAGVAAGAAEVDTMAMVGSSHASLSRGGRAQSPGGNRSCASSRASSGAAAFAAALRAPGLGTVGVVGPAPAKAEPVDAAAAFAPPTGSTIRGVTSRGAGTGWGYERQSRSVISRAPRENVRYDQLHCIKTSTRLRNPLRKYTCTSSHMNQAKIPAEWNLPLCIKARRRPIVAIWPLSRYRKAGRFWPFMSRKITRAAC